LGIRLAAAQRVGHHPQVRGRSIARARDVAPDELDLIRARLRPRLREAALRDEQPRLCERVLVLSLLHQQRVLEIRGDPIDQGRGAPRLASILTRAGGLAGQVHVEADRRAEQQRRDEHDAEHLEQRKAIGVTPGAHRPRPWVGPGISERSSGGASLRSWSSGSLPGAAPARPADPAPSSAGMSASSPEVASAKVVRVTPSASPASSHSTVTETCRMRLRPRSSWNTEGAFGSVVRAISSRRSRGSIASTSAGSTSTITLYGSSSRWVVPSRTSSLPAASSSSSSVSSRSAIISAPARRRSVPSERSPRIAPPASTL